MRMLGFGLHRFAAPVGAALLLTACAGASTISRVDIAHNYQSIELGRFHGGDNALRVVVYGDPFGDPPARVSNAVVAMMQGHTGGPRVTFSAAPAPPPRPNWRAVMVINPTDVTLSDDICRLTAPPATVRSAGDQIRIVAAFCQGDYAATRATGRARAVNGLASRDLDAMLALLNRALFPTRNPHDERFRCRLVVCP